MSNKDTIDLRFATIVVVVGTLANEEQAKAVPQIGNASSPRQKARRRQDGCEVDKPRQRKKSGPPGCCDNVRKSRFI
jgi:hypothetical protein